MSSLGHHIRLRLKDDRVIASTPQERRIVATSVLGLGRRHNLLSYGTGDNHLHVASGTNKHDSMELARRVEISLQKRLRLAVPFVPAYPEPIVDQRHLLNAFRYDLRQSQRHGLDWDPYHEGSNLPDLLSLRVLGGYTAGNVRRLLPRVKREELLEILGVAELRPADGPPDQVIPAVIRAAGVPEIVGHSRRMNQLRRVVIEIVGGGIPSRTLARLLKVGKSTLFAVARSPLDNRLVLATRLQLGLHQALGEHRNTWDEPEFVAEG
jgi:hypothetical protein